jgi:hypothetical protein
MSGFLHVTRQQGPDHAKYQMFPAVSLSADTSYGQQGNDLIASGDASSINQMRMP